MGSSPMKRKENALNDKRDRFNQLLVSSARIQKRFRFYPDQHSCLASLDKTIWKSLSSTQVDEGVVVNKNIYKI